MAFRALGIAPGLLIHPQGTHMVRQVTQAIVPWAQQGGRLVLVGECLQKDERHRSLANLRPADGSALRIEASGDPGHYHVTLGPVFEATMRRPCRAVDGDGQLLDGVEMRTAVGENDRLFYAVNMRKTAVTFGFSPRPPGELVELLHEQRVELPMSLQPLDVVVLLTRQ